jgi:NTE family protein
MTRVAAVALAMLLAACAPLAPFNPPLAKHDPTQGYRYELLPAEGEPERLFVILTFSGGGTRAAALSYGVLEALRDTPIRWQGRNTTLLDEVDVISSISGGSFTAAWYALHGKKIFEAFPDRFLYRDVQGELVRELLSPTNWPRLALPQYGRSDLAADFHDRELFGGATFGDLARARRRPYVILNATDMTSGAPFSFTQDQFDLLCSDLSGVKVARAVASSSAFPGALTPLTFQNYSGTCGYRQPGWVENALEDARVDARRAAQAENRVAYTRQVEDKERGGTRPARPWLHLTDGGVADNLGLRGPLEALTSPDPAWSVQRMKNNNAVDKVVVIAVNAAVAPSIARDQSATVPGLFDTAFAAADVPLGNYTFDTVELFNNTLDEFTRDRRLLEQCNALAAKKGAQCALNLPGVRKVDYYGVHVAFEYLASEKERAEFRSLPTSFALPRETVDKVRAVGARLLREDPGFRKLLEDLR